MAKKNEAKYKRIQDAIQDGVDKTVFTALYALSIGELELDQFLEVFGGQTIPQNPLPFR
jgi:hypothetical protein